MFFILNKHIKLSSETMTKNQNQKKYLNKKVEIIENIIICVCHFSMLKDSGRWANKHGWIKKKTLYTSKTLIHDKTKREIYLKKTCPLLPYQILYKFIRPVRNCSGWISLQLGMCAIGHTHFNDQLWPNRD